MLLRRNKSRDWPGPGPPLKGRLGRNSPTKRKQRRNSPPRCFRPTGRKEQVSECQCLCGFIVISVTRGRPGHGTSPRATRWSVKTVSRGSGPQGAGPAGARAPRLSSSTPGLPRTSSDSSGTSLTRSRRRRDYTRCRDRSV